MDNNYNFEIFSKNLSNLRRKNKMCINDVAEKTGVDKWSLLAAEANADSDSISIGELLKICRFFDKTLDEMFSE